MALSQELIDKFVQATKDEVTEERLTKVYGTVVEVDGKKLVSVDGSLVPTPVVKGVGTFVGDRVIVSIENNVATVETNLGHPASDTIGTLTNEEDIDELVKNTTFMDALQTNVAYIGDKNTNHLLLNSGGVLIRNGNVNLASFDDEEFVLGTPTNPLKTSFMIVNDGDNPAIYLKHKGQAGREIGTKITNEFIDLSGDNFHYHTEDGGSASSDSKGFIYGAWNNVKGLCLGYDNQASGYYNALIGEGLRGAGVEQVLIGTYNAKADSRQLLVVGNGNSKTDRSDAFSVDSDGNVYVKGDIYYHCDNNGDNGTKVSGSNFIIVEQSISTGTISSGSYYSTTMDFANVKDKILAVSYIRSSDSDIVPYRWDFEGKTVHIGVRNVHSSGQSATIYVGVLTTA